MKVRNPKLFRQNQMPRQIKIRKMIKIYFPMLRERPGSCQTLTNLQTSFHISSHISQSNHSKIIINTNININNLFCGGMGKKRTLEKFTF